MLAQETASDLFLLLVPVLHQGEMWRGVRQLNPRVVRGSETWQIWEAQNELRADAQRMLSNNHKDKQS